MRYTSQYESPLGDILLVADEIGLIGLWFYGQKYFAQSLDTEHEPKETPVLAHAKLWLDQYFSGKEPDFVVPLHLTGTKFQMDVWEKLCGIPYGQTMTYAEIAKRVAEKRGLQHMSAQAVGEAIAHNPISIIVPCHRVIRSSGDLGGYAAGIEKKKALLSLEYLPSGTPMNRILIDDETEREILDEVWESLNGGHDDHRCESLKII